MIKKVINRFKFDKFNKMSFNKKITFVIILFVLVVGIVIGYPTFCQLLEGAGAIQYWDGNTARSFAGGSGTASNPYKISNASQFMRMNNYSEASDVYFELTNDIYFNPGFFEYDILNDVIVYVKDSVKYFIPKYSNTYYSELECINPVGNVVESVSIDSINGSLDGNDYHVSGFFINESSDDNENFSFIKNVTGSLSSIVFDNYIVYSDISSSVIGYLSDTIVSSIIFNGNIIVDPKINLLYATLNENTNTNYISAPILNVDFNSDINSISGIISKGNIVSPYIASGIVGISNSNATYYGCVTYSNIVSSYYATGFVYKCIGDYIFSNCIYSGNILSDVISSAFCMFSLDGTITFNNNYYNGNMSNKDIDYISVMIYSYVNTPVGNNNFSSVDGIKSFYVDDVSYNVNLFIYRLGSYELFKNVMNFPEFVDSSNDGLLYFIIPNDGNIPRYYFEDNSLPVINIKIGNNEYTNLVETIKNIYIDEELSFDVNVDDENIKYIEYYLYDGDNISSIDIESFDWKYYTNSINIIDDGNYLLYVKATDWFGNISYANTDMFIYRTSIFLNTSLLYGASNSYSVVGSDSDQDLSTYDYQITKNTKIKYNYSISNNNNYVNGDYFKIEFSNSLPKNTSIIMIDNINNESYYYVTNKSISSLLLMSFDSQGKQLSKNNHYKLNPFNYCSASNCNINFSFIFDFSNVEISSNLVFNTSFNIYNEDDNLLLNIDTSDKSINIIKNDSSNQLIKSGVLFSSNYSGSVNLSSTSAVNIPIISNNSLSTYSGVNVYDSNSVQKSYYLDISLVDYELNTYNGNIINSIEFKLNNQNYYSKSNGHVIIPWSSNTVSETKNLTITPSYVVNELKNGNYYFKIANYCSNCSTKTTQNDYFLIPVSINNNTTVSNSSFDVNIPSNDRYIIKDNDTLLNNTSIMNLDIYYTGELINPKVYVSLYRKYNYSAYNQNYELVDLNHYLNDNLSSTSISYVYELLGFIDHNNNTPVMLNMDCSSFDLGGYKLVFDLYDDNALIKSVSKTLVVK